MRDGSGNYVAPSNSWNPAISGQQAVYSDWQAILNDIVAALTQSVSRDGQTVMTGNLQMGGNKITGQSAATGAGQALIYEQLFNQGAEQDLASAATTDIGAQLTNFLRITGTTTITSFGTNYKGPRFLRFEGAVTLTNGSALTLPGGANITTAVGDCLIAIPRATLGIADGWQVVGYQKNALPGTPSAGSVNNAALADGAVYGTKMTSKIEPVTASVASNALTVTLNPTTLDFRSSALGSGTVNTRTISTAISTVVPSGATLGTTNATLSKVMLLAIDNAGTVELAVCNGSLSLDESTLISTTVLDTSSDSASVIYSTTARTNVPFRIVGYVESTQATAGTWATSPSKIQGVGGQIRQASATGGGGITSGTAVTASGTSIDFTGIPSLVKRITVLFNAVSTSGSSGILIQVGSGSVSSSGYSSFGTRVTTGNSTSGASSSAGIFIQQSAGTNSTFGSVTLNLLGSNTWLGSGVLADYNASVTEQTGGGTPALGGALDRVRITTGNGTDTFDAGSINIIYEG